MNMRTIGIAVIVVALVAAFTGIASATPEGANMTATNKSTKDPSTVDTDDAQGGYITDLDAIVEQSTAKWQGYYGDVDGSIVLENDAGQEMFNWSWSAANGGEVLATTASIVSWGTVYNVTTTERDNVTGGINDLWGWQTNQSDDADATFDNVSGAVTVASTDISGTVATTSNKILPTGQGWQTLVISDDPTVEGRDDYIFVGLIRNGATGINGTADYQMIVPVQDTPGETVTYNFYVEMT